MKKSDRISAYVQSLNSTGPESLDPCYLGYFQCFNAGDYYEAHDVLEHLWLQTRDDNHLFFKGLIQLAGAYVHLRKQYLRPDHSTDGKRLRPAVRLFRLALANLEPYGPEHLQLDVAAVCTSARRMIQEVETAEFARNPWSPNRKPELHLIPQ